MVSWSVQHMVSKQRICLSRVENICAAGGSSEQKAEENAAATSRVSFGRCFERKALQHLYSFLVADTSQHQIKGNSRFFCGKDLCSGTAEKTVAVLQANM